MRVRVCLSPASKQIDRPCRMHQIAGRKVNQRQKTVYGDVT